MVSPGLAGESSMWSGSAGSLAPPATSVPTATMGKPTVGFINPHPRVTGPCSSPQQHGSETFVNWISLLACQSSGCPASLLAVHQNLFHIFQFWLLSPSFLKTKVRNIQEQKVTTGKVWCSPMVAPQGT